MNESQNGKDPIPVISEVDLLVVGGGSGAVAAALAARRAGASVYLVAPRPYLGDDIAARFDYWPHADDEFACDVARSVFPQGADPEATPPTPMHVKLTLEQAMVDAGAPFLLNAHVAGAIRDEGGRLAGAVIADRAGRQAILASAVIDATERGLLARAAGAAVTDPPTGKLTARHVTIGGDHHEVDGATLTALPPMVATIEEERTELPAREYRIEIELERGDHRELAAAYADLADRCWAPGVFQQSERLDLDWPDRIAGEPKATSWPGCAALDLDALAFEANAYALGPVACVADAVAGALRRPAHAMAIGERLGAHLAGAALPAPSGALHVAAAGSQRIERGTVKTLLGGLRPGDEVERTLTAPANDLPRLGRFDVVVVGGGTGGAPAGIAAGRAGASTLICENLPVLGGVGTAGQIARYYFGNLVGFTSEIDRAVRGLESDEAIAKQNVSWSPQAKQAWYHREARRVGCELWFGTICCGAWVEGGRVRGVVLAGPFGYGLVEAGAVIDATGNADAAAAAGARTTGIDADHVAVQGTGLAGINPGHCYHNTDHSFSDETDPVDATGFLVAAKRKFAGFFDAGQLIDSRERRQIIGDVTLEPADFFYKRTFPDSICLASSNFDTHGFTIHPAFMVKPPNKDRRWVYVPYRCLLPRGLDGILVTGLGVSAHRDAIPVIRMQGDVQNQGYAAGRAAATAAAQGIGVRDIDVKALQRHLVEIGNLPENVLTDEDNFPVDNATLARAVDEGVDTYEGLALIFAEAERAKPMLRAAIDRSDDPEARQRYAQVLALMGDGRAADVLREAVAEADWDEGWNYRGMGQFGMSMSPLDAKIIGLGHCDDQRAWPVLLEKIRALGEEPDFSHCRAVAEACEALHPRHRNDEAATALVEVLQRPGIAGHAQPTLHAAHEALTDNSNETQVRNRSLREIHLARAALRCGDPTGRAESILRQYAEDLRGHYARHARAVLRETRQPALTA